MEINYDGFEVFESKMNIQKTVKQKFEIIESIETFHHDMFLTQIKDQMQYFGIDIPNLSVSVRISELRLGLLLKGKARFEPEERTKLMRRLNF